MSKDRPTKHIKLEAGNGRCELSGELVLMGMTKDGRNSTVCITTGCQCDHIHFVKNETMSKETDLVEGLACHLCGVIGCKFKPLKTNAWCYRYLVSSESILSWLSSQGVVRKLPEEEQTHPKVPCANGIYSSGAARTGYVDAQKDDDRAGFVKTVPLQSGG